MYPCQVIDIVRHFLQLVVFVSWCLNFIERTLNSVYFTVSVSSALCLLPQRAAVLRRFKAATKHEILVRCVPAVLFCTCKHKSHIDEVSAATRHPQITASVKLHRFNANGMWYMNNYILPSKFNLMWDKRVQWDFFILIFLMEAIWQGSPFYKLSAGFGSHAADICTLLVKRESSKHDKPALPLISHHWGNDTVIIFYYF